MDGLTAPPRGGAPAAAADRRRAGARGHRPAGAATACCSPPAPAREGAARTGIERMRFATGVDDDLRPFYDRFRGRPGDRPLGPRQPRPARAPAAGSVPDADGRDHRAADRARARDGDPAAADRGVRLPLPRHRDARRADAGRDRLPGAGAARRRSTSRPSARSRMRRCAEGVARGRIDLHAHDYRRLLAIRDIGPWTVEMLALHGQGRMDVVPAGDLGFLKIVGRLMTGNPRARADEAEVRGFFERYGEWKGLAGVHLMRAAAARAHSSPDVPGSSPSPGRNSLVSGARSPCWPREQVVRAHPLLVGVPLAPGPGSRTAGSASFGKKTGSVARTAAVWRPRSRPPSASSSASTPASGSRLSSSWPRAVACRKRRSRDAPSSSSVVAAGDEDELVVGRHAEVLHPQDLRLAVAALEVDALVVPERAERRVDLLGEHRRDEVEADVGLLHGVGLDPGLVEDRAQVGRLVREARGADALARELLRARDRVVAERHQRTSAASARARRRRPGRRPCRAPAAAPARRRSRGRRGRPAGA